jgi:peroxin-3
MLPTYPLPPLSTSDANPLPSMPPVHRPHLASLLEQTTIHLKSADATYLIEKGVTAMTKKMIEGLKEDLYTGSEIGLMLGEPAPEQEISRRLVDCLPAVDRWGKGVWDAIPDTGIEVSAADRQQVKLELIPRT